ncbi:hypothetical protein ABT346_20285 [Micromonospora peucetia]|uniref:hypothetical protein n=1 Tax=Micromonospora peucetia TaxID=47871 RepID=UPI00331FB774
MTLKESVATTVQGIFRAAPGDSGGTATRSEAPAHGGRDNHAPKLPSTRNSRPDPLLGKNRTPPPSGRPGVGQTNAGNFASNLDIADRSSYSLNGVDNPQFGR